MKGAAPFVLGLLLGASVLVLMGAPARRSELLRISDFSGIWAGGRAVAIGADPYDAGSWRTTASSLATQPPDTAVYGYTPWIALAMVPLAALPLELAAGTWTAAGILVAVAVATLWPSRPRTALALTAVGVALLVLLAPALYALAIVRGRETFGVLVPLLLTLAVVCALWPLRGPRPR